MRTVLLPLFAFSLLSGNRPGSLGLAGANMTNDSLDLVCGNLLNRDLSKLVGGAEFFTTTGLADYAKLYSCTRNEELMQGGVFADLTALNDLDTTSALKKYFSKFDAKSIVGIMGGSNLDRNTKGFRQTALIAKRITENGEVILTGGGPGAMEAAHLGAWFAGRPEAELDDAIAILSKVPKYVEKEWLNTASEVQEKYPRLYPGQDVAVATLVYGYRPPTSFASVVAKYANEATRAENIGLSATGAIIFTPGSEGTAEELAIALKFQTYRPGYKERPIILVDSEFWKPEVSEKKIGRVKLVDTVERVVELVEARRTPPIQEYSVSI